MKCTKMLTLFFLCGFFAVHLPLEAQTPGSLNTGTFGVFTDEVDWYLDTVNWTRAVPQKGAGYAGVAANSYKLGGAGKIGPVYLAGAYYGLITAYGDRDDTMTDETFVLMAGFTEHFALKFTYFDQNYPRGRGTAAPALYAGAVIPAGKGTLKLEAGAYGALKYSSGMVLDIIQPAMGLTVEYELNPDWSFAAGYTATPTFAGPKNSTDVSVIPVLHRMELWYRQSWNIGERFAIGFKLNVFSRLNLNRTAGNWDLSAGLPVSVHFKASDIFDLFAGIKIGYYYANFDYADISAGSGGNKKGSVPVTGFSLGFSVHMTKHATLQLAAQFERIPFYSAGSQYSISAKNLSLMNLLSEPLSASLRLSF